MSEMGEVPICFQVDRFYLPVGSKEAHFPESCRWLMRVRVPSSPLVVETKETGEAGEAQKESRVGSSCSRFSPCSPISPFSPILGGWHSGRAADF